MKWKIPKDAPVESLSGPQIEESNEAPPPAACLLLLLVNRRNRDSNDVK